MPSPDPNPRPANRLSLEPSPYLLQHQHNPVDWFPWGPEAFQRARSEDKPIFLSIGYSTCHWCHVMERESFEDSAVAGFLNQHFISIKVDREERPDVDKIYMTFVQATAGQGGWPLNVFLTPQLRPFFGGTYFPPTPRHGMPSFLQTLEQIDHLWSSRKEELSQSAAGIQQRLQTYAAAAGPGDDLNADVLDQAAARLQNDYDPQHGGFGRAPKFPRPCHPAFLLRQAMRRDDPAGRDRILHTCERMSAGGIHDQLGGGFHRYAVDAAWLVPHFEKMLYDNAQLVHLYLDAFLISHDPQHAATARDILDYVARDLSHPDGGFYSAEDADSEGHEGKFYCWTLEELTAALTPEELRIVLRRFGVTREGNFVDHSHPQPLPGQNILSLVNPALADQEVPALASALDKLRAIRSRRVRPHRDDKVLTSWNGLMLGATARAAAVLDEARYQTMAERNLAFLRTHLWDPARRTLHHRWREGRRDTTQLLDAYAFLLNGTIDLYQTTLASPHLEFAVALAEAMIQRFHDPDHGAFFQSVPSPDLILRLKEDYDGAEPSGNSVATLALLRLASLTERRDFHSIAEGTLRCFSDRLHRHPEMVPALLLALDHWLHEPHRVVITGDPHSPAARRLLQAAHAVYQPNKVVLGQSGPVEPFARSLPSPEEPTAYVCTGTACQPPTRDPAELQRILGG